MAYTPARLVAIAVPTTMTTVYTVGAGANAIAKFLAVTNTTAGALTFSIQFAANDFAVGVSIPANTTTNIPVMYPLTAAQTIRVSASATGLVVHVTGVTY